MGLLKGSRIRYTNSDAVIGDEVFTPDEPEFVETSAVVPQAAPAPRLPADQSEAGDWGTVPETLEHVVEEAYADPNEAVASSPLHDYDGIRDHLIEGALEAAERDAEAFGQELHGEMAGVMSDRLAHAETALLEANPAADFAKVQPYVQGRVAVELDLEQLGTVSELRWTHLKRIEEKITSETDEVAEYLETLHPPESFAELLAQREQILSAARLEAEQLVMQARTRAAEALVHAEQLRERTFQELEQSKEAILAELREQAYSDGYFEGKSAGEAEAANYIQEALMAVNQLALELPRAVKQNEEKLVSLALEIASKVIQEEIALQPEIVQRTVETSLRRVSDLEQVVVKVNPLDLDLILPKQDTFKSIVPDVQSFSIEGSHTIARGGCLIETNSGTINATINTQLAIIDELFRKVRSEYEDDTMGDMS